MNTEKNNVGFPWHILFAGIVAGIIVVVLLLAAGSYRGWWKVSSNQYPGNMIGFNHSAIRQGMMGGVGDFNYQDQLYWDNFDNQLMMMENDISQIRDYHNLMQNEVDEVNSLSGPDLTKISTAMNKENGEIVFSINGKKWSIGYKRNNRNVVLDLSQLNKAVQVNPKMNFQIKIIDVNGKTLRIIDNKNVSKNGTLSLDEKDGKSLIFYMSVMDGTGGKFATSQTI